VKDKRHWAQVLFDRFNLGFLIVGVILCSPLAVIVIPLILVGWASEKLGCEL
jgi:hypothetical protein